MEIEFDPAKDRSNFAKHGILLSRAVEIEILNVVEDDRQDYGEVRYLAWGLIDGLHHVMAFTPRGPKIRIISLRRAHTKEMKRYVRN